MKISVVFIVVFLMLGGCAIFSNPPPSGSYQGSITILSTTPHDVLNDIAIRTTKQHTVSIASYTDNQLVWSMNGGEHMGTVQSNNGVDFGFNLQMIHHTYTVTFIAIQVGKNVVLNVTGADNGMAVIIPPQFISQMDTGLERDGFKIATN